LTRSCCVAMLLPYGMRSVVVWSARSRVREPAHQPRHQRGTLVLAGLEKALEGHKPEPGWIHHSDQGVQYACRGHQR
jgi:hypothetical protein